jgi:hypothetical protein
MQTNDDYYNKAKSIISYLEDMRGKIGLITQRLKEYHKTYFKRKKVVVFFPDEPEYYVGLLPAPAGDGLVICEIFPREVIYDWKDIEEDLDYNIKALIECYQRGIQEYNN